MRHQSLFGFFQFIYIHGFVMVASKLVVGVPKIAGSPGPF